MIRPLRRAHGVASLLLGLVVIATLLAAIGLRVEAPVPSPGALDGRP